MTVWKRILAVVIMAVSVILIILCVGGIAGSWFVNGVVTNDIVKVLTGVEKALGIADGALLRLDTRVGDARERVAAFEEAIQSASENFADNPVVLTALSERLDLGIEPAISDLRDTVQSIRETVLSIQSTIEAINALPFVSIGEKVPGRESLQELSDGITRVTEGVQETRTAIREAKEQVASQVVSAVGKGTSKLDDGLLAIETAVADYGTQASELRTGISELKASVIFWLDVASVIATLLLLWLIFSQVVVFILGLSIFRNENLFSRWTGGAAEQPSA